VPALAASRRRLASDRQAVALALPGPIDADSIASEIARRLRLARDAITVRTMALDRQEYLIAAWPDVDDPVRLERLAELAEDLDGELIERAARRLGRGSQAEAAASVDPAPTSGSGAVVPG
jgi:hypothetical protein